MPNDAGVEGLVAWRKIQARKDAPVRLNYGYAMTVDTAQGSTATEHIQAPADRLARDPAAISCLRAEQPGARRRGRSDRDKAP